MTRGQSMTEAAEVTMGTVKATRTSVMVGVSRRGRSGGMREVIQQGKRCGRGRNPASLLLGGPPQRQPCSDARATQLPRGGRKWAGVGARETPSHDSRLHSRWLQTQRQPSTRHPAEGLDFTQYGYAQFPIAAAISVAVFAILATLYSGKIYKHRPLYSVPVVVGGACQCFSTSPKRSRWLWLAGSITQSCGRPKWFLLQITFAFFMATAVVIHARGFQQPSLSGIPYHRHLLVLYGISLLTWSGASSALSSTCRATVSQRRLSPRAGTLFQAFVRTVCTGTGAAQGRCLPSTRRQ
ncbi:hypothetical protein GGTG_05056 [Gaeumannomyces tritici R3-111a-1]|uniref:Uncharacterized protein n=1 Tax=Gaeumannomyces tritici (strain R3-111a-1) TaxID=644352 RepID=J3NUV0_GAET3|nr:hypothetical protein GGTG_05056 [Gaeumannomyces tritici R3-111a-1]EJT79974.1 hypothetical protein GGTG_05056 [Gaeumannomyces tritici R3-111a-1]